MRQQPSCSSLNVACAFAVRPAAMPACSVLMVKRGLRLLGKGQDSTKLVMQKQTAAGALDVR